MAIYDTLKNSISSVIYENANNEITGGNLENILLDMVSILGDATFGGVIIPTTSFSPDDRLYWFIASTNGTYSDFNNLEVENEIAIFTYNGAFAKYKLCDYYLPELPLDSTLFLNGNGEFSTPTTPPNSHLKQTFTGVTSVVINHGFGVAPLVQCFDSNNISFIPYRVINNEAFTSTTIVFTMSKTGYVIANVGSPAANTYVKKLTNYTITSSDYFIEASNPSLVFTLPSAVGIESKIFEIINGSNGILTINAINSETIGNDSNAQSTFTLNQSEVLKIISDGINYKMI